MFSSHTAKAAVTEVDIKRALELLAKDKGMPFDIEVTKFFYRKKELHFSYSMKEKEAADVMTCSQCNRRRSCKVLIHPTLGVNVPVCGECKLPCVMTCSQCNRRRSCKLLIHPTLGVNVPVCGECKLP